MQMATEVQTVRVFSERDVIEAVVAGMRYAVEADRRFDPVADRFNEVGARAQASLIVRDAQVAVSEPFIARSAVGRVVVEAHRRGIAGATCPSVDGADEYVDFLLGRVAR